MRVPAWSRWLLSRLAGPERAGEVVGDLEEAHRERVDRRGRLAAGVLTSLETVDMALALVRLRLSGRRWRGGAERPGAAARRGAAWASWLDVKLGLRMLVKHPGLSLVSVLGMAVAVAMGASVFGVIRGMTSSPLPLHEGDRIVAIRNLGPFGMEQARATHLHDVARWREGASAVGELAAYRIVTRNVLTRDGGVTPARVVEITASGFRIARVPPVVGRPLLESDEVEGAAAVAVIGHGLWQERFGGRADILGQEIQVGGASHEIVGVMPPGFGFPVNNRLWTPLRLDPSDFEVGKAPAVNVFGRLAAGSSLGEAAAQLAVIGERAAAENPATHARLRPRVSSYTKGLVSGPLAFTLYLIQVMVTGLLLVIAINVAALVYARTVARTGEIAVRTALGASRGRIAWQLFAESLVLTGAAAAVGLLVAGLVTDRIELHVRVSGGEETPFWWDFGVSPAVLAYAAGAAVLAAGIIGVVPALGSTGHRLQARLKSVGSGASGPRLGRTWTALIVTQIAIAVAILPVGLSGAARWGLLDGATRSPLPLDEVLVTRLEIDDEATSSPGPADPAAIERRAALRQALLRRLEIQGEVAGVAVMPKPPWEDPDLPFELDVPTRAPLAGTPVGAESASSGHRVGRSIVGPEFFAVFDMPVLSGRALVESDALTEQPPVVVNRAFVDLVMGGANPLGRSLRFLDGAGGADAAAGPWHTIVGVVSELQPSVMSKPEAKAYVPARPAGADPVGLAIRVRGGDAMQLAGRVRRVAAEVDPRIRLETLETLETKRTRDIDMSRLMIVSVGVLSLSVLLLSVAGLYALMSFTVVRRHREIGIRTALGARPQRVLRSVLGRAAAQLAIGVTVGLALSVGVDRLAGGEIIGGRETLFLPLVVALMAAVGVAAAWGPARRGLRIQPTEALRAD